MALDFVGDFDPAFTDFGVLGTLGGSLAYADPAAEWQECLHKAAPIVATIGAQESRARRTAS